jgi:hypothetical protein
MEGNMPLDPIQEQVVLGLARNAGEDRLRIQKDADSHYRNIALANSAGQDTMMIPIWVLIGIIGIVVVLGMVWLLF